MRSRLEYSRTTRVEIEMIALAMSASSLPRSKLRRRNTNNAKKMLRIAKSELGKKRGRAKSVLEPIVKEQCKRNRNDSLTRSQDVKLKNPSVIKFSQSKPKSSKPRCEKRPLLKLGSWKPIDSEKKRSRGSCRMHLPNKLVKPRSRECSKLGKLSRRQVRDKTQLRSHGVDLPLLRDHLLSTHNTIMIIIVQTPEAILPSLMRLAPMSPQMSTAASLSWMTISSIRTSLPVGAAIATWLVMMNWLERPLLKSWLILRIDTESLPHLKPNSLLPKSSSNRPKARLKFMDPSTTLTIKSTICQRSSLHRCRMNRRLLTRHHISTPTYAMRNA